MEGGDVGGGGEGGAGEEGGGEGGGGRGGGGVAHRAVSTRGSVPKKDGVVFFFSGKKVASTAESEERKSTSEWHTGEEASSPPTFLITRIGITRPPDALLL